MNPNVWKTSNYVIAEIRERELLSIWLSKYITVFHCFDKDLIVLSATSAGVSISLFATVIRASKVAASKNFSFAFSLIKGIIKHYKKQHETRKRAWKSCYFI